MSRRAAVHVSGYVLAGGRSLRMGRNKALLELAGRPLVAHAVAKLRLLCEEVAVLSGESSDNSALGRFAPLVADLHPGCGPLGGVEAALHHAGRDWSLILPTDVPFLPVGLLRAWVGWTVGETDAGARASIFTVGGVPHPALLLIHRELRPWVERSCAEGDYKLLRVIERGCRAVAEDRGVAAEAVLRNVLLGGGSSVEALLDDGDGVESSLSEVQKASRMMWFANLNTPEEFAEAERHIDALDPIDDHGY